MLGPFKISDGKLKVSSGKFEIKHLLTGTVQFNFTSQESTGGTRVYGGEGDGYPQLSPELPTLFENNTTNGGDNTHNVEVTVLSLNDIHESQGNIGFKADTIAQCVAPGGTSLNGVTVTGDVSHATLFGTSVYISLSKLPAVVNINWDIS